jgi:hypothetical protein
VRKCALGFALEGIAINRMGHAAIEARPAADTSGLALPLSPHREDGDWHGAVHSSAVSGRPSSWRQPF